MHDRNLPRARRIALAVVMAAPAIVGCAANHSSDIDGDPVSAASVGVPDADIWILDVSTGATRRLLSSPKFEGAPAWSPDGQRIAFGRLESGDERAGDADIWIANVVTGELDHVLGGPQRDVTPAWSPDGRRLAFESDRSGNAEIWIIDLEVDSLTQLTNHPANDAFPAFSPDGQRLVFVSDRSGHQQLWVLDAAGGEPAPLAVPHEEQVTFPAWSPTGSSIAYVRQPGQQFPELWITEIDGGKDHRIDDVISPSRPAWSPDGITIAVRDDADGHLYGVDTRTWARWPLTVGDGDDFYPTWSPDGSQIAYTSVPNPTGSG